MKRYALLIIVYVSVFTSCSLESKGPDSFYSEFMPIESVEIPEYFVYGESYEILLNYVKPSSCYHFYDFYYEINSNERIVAIINTIYTDTSCIEEPQSISANLNFMVTDTETYIFKFYQGEDEDGQDQYYLVEVPVLDERPILESAIKKRLIIN